MADFSKTISNSVRIFGGGPSTRWGSNTDAPYTMVWGAAFWGENNSTPFIFTKIISSSITPLSADVLSVYYYKTITDSIDQSSTVQPYRYLRQSVTSNFSTSGILGHVYKNSNIWRYVFEDNTDDVLRRTFTTWTSASVTNDSFSSLTAPTTIWT